MSLRPPKGWKLGRDSFSKMIIWFADGNVRTMFSIDWRHRFSQNRDREIGLRRYRKMIKEYGSRAAYIEIYDKESGKLLYRYREGSTVDLKKIKRNRGGFESR